VVVTSRICLDQLGSARARRERYVGPWLPEPLIAVDDDPADRVTLDESVRMALLVVLEQLTPPERVAFVLHDVFGFAFEQVAGVVGRSPAAARQLASRARRRVREEDPVARFTVDPDEEQAVADRFLSAAQGGDLEALAQLLDPEVVMRADGGGLVQAPRRPIAGRDTIVKVIANGYRTTPGLTVAAATVNGGPGMLVRDGEGRLVSVAAFAIADGVIKEIDLLAQPEKLAALGL
jgi:RNA polymerase sigma-70 factor (ECF subfamily)